MAASQPAMDPQSSRPFVCEEIDRARHGEATIDGKLKNPFFIWVTTKNRVIEDMDEGDNRSLIARHIGFSVGPSVVGLTSYAGDELLLNCSGFVIEGNGVVATILTSASLLIGDEDSMPSYVTVKVHLPNRDTVSGSVSHVDLHHNVATITVSVPDLCVATLLPNAEPFSIGSVVALGRHAITSNLQAFHGEVLLKDYDIDSEDVLSSSCSITHYGIGGPLIDTSSGSIIGMCFSDSNCTVFLPNNILLRCLKHFKSYGKVFRPWLGMRTRILDTLKLAHLETIYQKFPDINGIFVEKVIKGSPADAAGVLPGDIITHCDQISVCSPLAFVEILFDKAESTKDLNGDRARDYAVKKRKIAVEVTIRRENISSSVNKGIIVDRFDPPEHNRWPLRRYSELKF
ncbi:unnamed protein product [Amaranthus hypochondriacus]